MVRSSHNHSRSEQNYNYLCIFGPKFYEQFHIYDAYPEFLVISYILMLLQHIIRLLMFIRYSSFGILCGHLYELKNPNERLDKGQSFTRVIQGYIHKVPIHNSFVFWSFFFLLHILLFLCFSLVKDICHFNDAKTCSHH